jgi:hypothetical protein
MPPMSPRTFAGPLLVTVVYVAVYYLLFANQLRVKTRLRRAYRARGETFDRYFHTDREMLAADRYVGNMLEHMPAFLVLLLAERDLRRSARRFVRRGCLRPVPAALPLHDGTPAGQGRPGPDHVRDVHWLRGDRVSGQPPGRRRDRLLKVDGGWLRRRTP